MLMRAALTIVFLELAPFLAGPCAARDQAVLDYGGIDADSLLTRLHALDGRGGEAYLAAIERLLAETHLAERIRLGPEQGAAVHAEDPVAWLVLRREVADRLREAAIAARERILARRARSVPPGRLEPSPLPAATPSC